MIGSAPVLARVQPSYHVVLSDRALDYAKVFAVLLMVLDHINTYLLHGSNHLLFAVGRLAFPLFAFVFSANMVRANVRGGPAGKASRLQLLKLIGFGAAAQIPFSLMHGQVWPLNILFLFALVSVLGDLARNVERSFTALPALLGLFVVGGAVVEFFWCGVLMVFAFIHLHQRGIGAWTVLFAIGATSTLALVNENQWALGALLIVLALRAVDGERKWTKGSLFFYMFYPAHLYAIWLISVIVAIGRAP